MKLKLNRKWFTDKSTIGILYINDEFFCYTLEDVVRPVGEKMMGKTAIPWGNYKVDITESNRFKKSLPILLNVPNFVGVRIHSGNNATNTEGCILVGSTHTTDFIGNSRVTMDKLMSILNQINDSHEDITIEISAEATA